MMKARDKRMTPTPPPTPPVEPSWVEGEVKKCVRNAYWALEYGSRLLMDEAPADETWGLVDDAQCAVEDLAKKLNIDLRPDI